MSAQNALSPAPCAALNENGQDQMWNVDGVPNRECAACGYADTLDERGNSVPRELPTRVNISALKCKPVTELQTVAVAQPWKAY
jgi:uncharacterized metal-binding protein (TIGR02443 family)